MLTLWRHKNVRLAPLAHQCVLAVALAAMVTAAPQERAAAESYPPLPAVKPAIGSPAGSGSDDTHHEDDRGNWVLRNIVRPLVSSSSTTATTGSAPSSDLYPLAGPASLSALHSGENPVAAFVVVPARKPAIFFAAKASIQNMDAVPLPLRKPDSGSVMIVAAAGAPNDQAHSMATPTAKPQPQPKPQLKPQLKPMSKPMGKPGTPLTPENALLYKKIFAAQENADWGKADKLLAMLSDYRLRGHIMYQRYMHPTAYRAQFEELAAWVEAYADHPGADKIYRLAQSRKPAGYQYTLREPQQTGGITGYLDALHEYDRVYTADIPRNTKEKQAIAALIRAVDQNITKGAPTKALAVLQSSDAAKLMDAGEYDGQLALIANGFMMAGNIAKAHELASSAARRSGELVPRAGWVSGLILWRHGDYKQAAPYFAQVAQSDYGSAWSLSAGAYWASRAYTRSGNIQEAQRWLKQAASHPRTFYGLIATRALGWNFDFNWDMPAYGQSYAKILRDYEGARRAMLLAQAEQYHIAEDELRRIPVKDRKMTQALMAYAAHAGLPSYAMRLAYAVRTPDGRFYDAGLYPLAPWTPKNGYKVDRALIHALIRQESKFNPSASNRYSGATGLMQLMPRTATYVSGEHDFRSRTGHHILKNPQINLDIGQRYVQELMYQDIVGSELFSLVIAYNAGPGNLRRWKRELASLQDDPLLFVESIPMRETRAFVERVMANYWIYRMRLGQSTPSLDAVAEGRWAHYISMDDDKMRKSLRHAGLPSGKGIRVAVQ